MSIRKAFANKALQGAQAAAGQGVAAMGFVHAGGEEIAEVDAASNTVLWRYVPRPEARLGDYCVCPLFPEDRRPR